MGEPVSAMVVIVMVSGVTPFSGEVSVAPVHALGVVLPFGAVPPGATVSTVLPLHAETTSRSADRDRESRAETLPHCVPPDSPLARELAAARWRRCAR